MWLDEEWAPLEVHKALGAATGSAYAKARAAGVSDISDVLMALSNDLMSFDYRETFTSSFEVREWQSPAMYFSTMYYAPRVFCRDSACQA